MKILLFKDDQTVKSAPQWYQNFAKTLKEGSVVEANRQLKSYNATFLCDRPWSKKGPWGSRYIEFKTASDYTAFVLTWS